MAKVWFWWISGLSGYDIQSGGGRNLVLIGMSRDVCGGGRERILTVLLGNCSHPKPLLSAGATRVIWPIGVIIFYVGRSFFAKISQKGGSWHSAFPCDVVTLGRLRDNRGPSRRVGGWFSGLCSKMASGLMSSCARWIFGMSHELQHI